jgi:hypothetical protein
MRCRVRECAIEAADGGAARGHDYDIGHLNPLILRQCDFRTA